MRRRVRQAEIAEKLGLSINTISLALKDSSRINIKTRLKVQEMAKSLNYIPNSIARSLVQKKTNIVGFVLPRITNPIQIETAQRIERKLMLKGYNMMLMTTDSDKDYEARALDILLSHQVDGIFLYPTNKQNQEKIKSLKDANYPIVLLSGGNYNLSNDSVYMNQTIGAYKAIMHLVQLGHSRIAFIDGKHANTEKHSGYKLALKDSNLEYIKKLIITVDNFSYEEGYSAASRIFSNKTVTAATAIFASSDYLALGALRWCHEQGLRVPHDVAIVGFDDLEAARFAEVPLTTVTYPMDELITQAVDLICSLISTQEDLSSLKPTRIEIEPTLMIRESSGNKLN